MDHAEILALYDRRRAVSRPMSDDLVKYGSRAAMQEAARRLGVLVRGTLMFDNESDVTVFGDMLAFDQWSNGENAVRRMLRAVAPAAGTIEREVLEAMRDARHSIFVGKRVEPGVGVYFADYLRPDVETLVVDRGLAMSGGGVVMAARLLYFPEFAMTTGAGIPVGSAAVLEQVTDALVRRYGMTTPDELYNLPPQQRSEAAFIVTRVLLARAQTRQVAYADRPDLEEPRELSPEMYPPVLPGSAPALTVTPRIGRNEPCPCGSGKKFKRCHGGGDGR
jgi:hypothetical protein